MTSMLLKHPFSKIAISLLSACCTNLLLSSTAVADYVGPAVVAKADIRLWEGTLDTPAGFDRASRAAILLYVHTLQDMQRLSDAEMLASFKIKSINRASVDKWVEKELKLSLLNYQQASVSCTAGDWTCRGSISSVPKLLEQSNAVHLNIPNSLSEWRDNLDNFAHSYLSEQVRLAALFPKVSSEIDLFNEYEISGDNLADRHFLLTFDDGPTPTSGTTDETLDMLKTQNKSAVFFVLGERFDARVRKSNAAELSTLYSNQCVGLHGWEHQSHAKLDQWQDSIIRTQSILESTLPNSEIAHSFRPPYGQRRSDSETFFRANNLRVALWNLDSQDWNSHVAVDDITNRMITLMLIKRRGILLFHDVHPKAFSALPAIFKKTGNSVIWDDCHQLDKM